MVVFLLLGVVWAAVLIPPWLQSRREARPIASMMSFRSQLWSLERATPHYGADTYTTYGDDAYGDEYASGDDADGYGYGYGDPAHGGMADVHPFDTPRRAVGAPAPAPGVEPAAVLAAGLPAAAAARRRALAYRRRRQVLAVLSLVALGGVAPAVLLGGPWVMAEAVAVTLLAAYVSLLVRRGRREAERAQKVRYLTPIRAPRPSVVVIGTGAAR